MVYELIKTLDNSYTFFNKSFNDIYHNRKGALSEAKFSFLEPIKRFLEKENKFAIFDIGFGLGYNSFLIKNLLISRNKEFVIFSFEKDDKLIKLIEKNLNLLPNEEKNKEYKKFFGNLVFLQKNKEIKEPKKKNHYLLLGDARIRVLEVKKLIESSFFSDYYKIVLHDGFSPIKNKDLWTFEFLSNFFNFDVFITYTNHVKVRSSLLLSNFYLFKTKAFGRKDGGTIAINKKLFSFKKKIEKLFFYELLNEKELCLLLTPYGKPFTEFISLNNSFLLSSNEVKKQKSSFLKFKNLLEKQNYIKKQEFVKDLLIKNLFNLLF